MKKAKTKTTITISLKQDTINELKIYSQDSLIPMSALIQKLVETFLSNQTKGGNNE